MCDGVEIGVRRHEQGCLVVCVCTEPSIQLGLQTQQIQPDVVPEYSMYWMHRMQSPNSESQDPIPLCLI